MDYENYLKLIKDDFHSVVVASSDENGNPITCVIDMMLADSNGLYFLTAKGKDFYKRIKENPNISLTGFKGKDTLSSQSITLKGEVKEIGKKFLDEIFTENPYMNEIYPTEESKRALSVFQIHKGSGEYFDLSSKPIFRESFSFGNIIGFNSIYFIKENCIDCGECLLVCPQNCISSKKIPYKIEQEHCLHCGNCKEVCPVRAVVKIKNESN